MNIRNLFDNSDDKTIDRITEKYPFLNADDKERLFVMSKNKYNSEKTENTKNYSEVMSVERYRKPVWQKALSAVAVAVVALGGIGGGIWLLGNGNGAGPMTDVVDSESIDEETTEDVEATEASEVVETVENDLQQDEYDYNAIATKLFDDYMELVKVVQFGDVAYDENECISFDIYDSADTGWTEKFGGEKKYYKVTDERFSCCQDIYEMVRDVTTDALSPDTNFESSDVHWFGECNLSSFLSSDVSIWEAGGKVDIAFVDFSDEAYDEKIEFYSAATDINNSVFIEYNGELYVRPVPYDVIEYTSDTVIKEVSENGFTASRYLKDWGSYMNYGNQIILEIVSENGEWQINSREIGAMVEYSSSVGIRNYLWSKPEYYDIELLDIIEHLEVTDYNDETLSCKVYGILPDINGEDAIEITAEVIISPSLTAGAVKSADIVRLNEYDGTLVRPEVLAGEDIPFAN